MIDKDILRTIQRLQTSPPVNIVGIAKYLGLEVWEDRELPDGISGKLFKDAKHGGVKQYSIVVRAQDPLVRKRFTVAHELAHYILHRNLFTDTLVDDALYRSHLSTRIEAQANGLAADLLMPFALLNKVLDQPINELAQIFQVSEEAMRIRLRQPLSLAG
ncbi:MAG TPA: ImmA/IrrE family metallo-endopeptidase [Bryobacteraceae bacterium]|jgi:Zn-dependent peptidase ImmA (M78 family)